MITIVPSWNWPPLIKLSNRGRDDHNPQPESEIIEKMGTETEIVEEIGTETEEM